MKRFVDGFNSIYYGILDVFQKVAIFVVGVFPAYLGMSKIAQITGVHNQYMNFAGAVSLELVGMAIVRLAIQDFLKRYEGQLPENLSTLAGVAYLVNMFLLTVGSYIIADGYEYVSIIFLVAIPPLGYLALAAKAMDDKADLEKSNLEKRAQEKEDADASIERNIKLANANAAIAIKFAKAGLSPDGTPLVLSGTVRQDKTDGQDGQVSGTAGPDNRTTGQVSGTTETGVRDSRTETGRSDIRWDKIVQHLTKSPDNQTVRGISDATGIPRSTVPSVLSGMVSNGLIEKDGSKYIVLNGHGGGDEQ